MRTEITAAVVCFLAMSFAMAWIAGKPSAPDETGNPTGEEKDMVYLGVEGVMLQNRGNNCGLTALMMVFEYHGIKISLGEMERKARLGRQGVSMLTLKELAQSFGLQATGWRLNFGDLPGVRFPAILFVENHHFLVLDSMGAGGFLFVRDPAIGRMRIPEKVLMDRWKGETLVFSNNTRSLE
ncbi:MAG: cysteine peptidase family C39 domain-containing protein [Ignavibacteria bacterium]|nr:cysteine peptidase family C39 domain-containing protein [Ignavibacteria bacterium]